MLPRSAKAMTGLPNHCPSRRDGVLKSSQVAIAAWMQQSFELAGLLASDRIRNDLSGNDGW
jgi:hypothetical protein